jgi:chemotaxis signal transduction protein
MGEESSLLLFSVRGFPFAVEVGSLLEVTVIDASCVSPEDGPFRYGFDFRGEKTPIVDLVEPSSMAGSLHLLVVDMYHHPVAFPVDRVTDVVKGEGAVYRFPRMLRTERNRYIKAVYRVGGRISFVIDPGLVLSDDQIAILRAS